MKETTIYILFSILRSIFHDNPMSDYDKQLLTDELTTEVIKLASKHDVSHLVALGLLNNGLVDDETKTQFQDYIVIGGDKKPRKGISAWQTQRKAGAFACEPKEGRTGKEQRKRYNLT